MQIHQINPENPRDVNRFILFPFELYRNCPQWVPPLVVSAKSALNPTKHPFYEHSIADFFIVQSGAQVLGRLAVMNNRRYNQYNNSRDAFWGMFEVVEDKEVALLLFTTACEWARRQGLSRSMGPRGMIGADASGILVEGFAHRPALQVPYNYAYYDAFIQAAGYEKDTDHLSGYLPGNYHLPERFHKIARQASQRRGYWVKTFSNKKEMWQWVDRVRAVHAQAFAGSHSFYPPTEREFKEIAGTLIEIADPRLIKLVMKGEEVVGFIFAYHDISAGLQKSNGRMWPFGWYYLLQERKHTKWVNVNGVGMLPKYQGLGGNTVLYAELEKTIHAFDFEHIDVVEVNEKNFKSKSDMEAIGVQWYKRHRSYKQNL